MDEAQAYLEESARLNGQVGNQAHGVFIQLGEIAHSREDYQQAKIMYTKTLEQLELIGEKYVKSFALADLGILARDEGDFQLAESYIQQALMTAKEVGGWGDGGFRLALLGQIEFLQGNLEGAKHDFKESLSIAKESQWRYPKIAPMLIFSNSYVNLQPRLAVRVLGALDAYWRSNLGEQADPLMKREFDSAIAQARQRLDESAFSAAWAEGEKMSLDEALDLALKTLEEM